MKPNYLTGAWFTLIDSFGTGWQFCHRAEAPLSYRLHHYSPGNAGQQPDPWTAITWYGSAKPPRDCRQAQLIAAAWLLEMDRYSANGPDYTGPLPRLAIDLGQGERLPGYVEA